ncbi:MAG TPA: hypothetical protein VMT37_02860 [Solirubrobacterales bacterium]|nr:hypothetical protein [Solirubrobacterales bacterium]
MSGAEASLAVSVFLACAVEAVEAFTIVLAVGTTRRWSSALLGVGAAVLVLAVLVGVLGSALTRLPIDALRLLVGVVLLAMGLQWLRKAVLRAAGRKALHDEAATFAEERAAAAEAPAEAGFDSYAFAVCFKAVLLEGLEVAFIVLTVGANQDDVALAATVAAVAVLVVLAAGLAARAPLARVPENTMKFAVGVLLTTFGVFWGAEGAGLSWPGGEAALPFLAAAVLAASLLAVRHLRRRPSAHGGGSDHGGEAEQHQRPAAADHDPARQ